MADSLFMASTGLVIDEKSATRVSGHLDLGPDHHTPFGVVHGGVYAAAIETAASTGASAAVEDQGMFAVGLTNTTHFLRAATGGRATVEAVAVNQGRTQQLWRAEIRDDQSRLLASGDLRLQNLPLDRAG